MKQFKTETIMIIADPQEHIKCPYYDNAEFPLIKIHKFAATDSTSITPRNNLLMFMTEGKLSYSMGNHRKIEAQKGDFILIPQGWSIELKIETDSVLMAFRLLERVSFCECYMIEQLFDDKSIEIAEMSADGCSEVAPGQSLNSALLKMNTPIWNYLFCLYSSISDGLMCRNYYELKIKELLYLLRAHYPKGQLYKLFNPVASPDTLFSDYVRANHRKHKTAAALAASMSLSNSSFARKFTKIFNQPPYKWMMEQKSEAIYAELTRSSKNLKHIASDFGFSSMTQFNDFCKTKWGRTPGAIVKTPLTK